MLFPPSYISAEQALQVIQSNHRVFVHGSACTPHHLLHALTRESERLSAVELIFISLHGDVPQAAADMAKAFHINCLFVSTPVREAVNAGRADFIPIFLSDIPDLFKKGGMPIDVALVQVSPPDAHGYCSLGPSVDIARTAVNTAKHIIAQVNPLVPRTHGDGVLHYSRFTAMVYCEHALPEVDYDAKTGAAEQIIGQHIAGLVEDKATIQMGIGAIPNAVLKSLMNHKHLGVHTEMCSDGIIDLIEKDVVDNQFKTIHPNRTVTSFALGSRKLYDYIDDNPSFAFLDIDFVNDPYVISRNPKVVAINSALEVDLTGQVCADSIGMYQYSGIGGQLDFMRGAALSEGGKPIIALTSRTRKGQSRIVTQLKEGAGVVTTRGHVHYLVTEFGVANLFGMNLRQRAKMLIDLAHPDDRAILHQHCFERFKIFI